MILIHTSLYASIVVVLSFMTNGIEPHSPRVKAAFQATLNLVFGPTAYCTPSCRTGLENLIGSYAGLVCSNVPPWCQPVVAIGVVCRFY